MLKDAAGSAGGGVWGVRRRDGAAHVGAGGPLENTAREYLANLRVQEAVYRSAAEGYRIELASFDPLQPAAVTAGAVSA